MCIFVKSMYIYRKTGLFKQRAGCGHKHTQSQIMYYFTVTSIPDKICMHIPLEFPVFILIRHVMEPRYKNNADRGSY